jgi:hypothetical protein
MKKKSKDAYFLGLMVVCGIQVQVGVYQLSVDSIAQGATVVHWTVKSAGCQKTG